MKTRTIITSFGCVALLFAACEVKDPIYNTPHPGKGAVILSTDWSARGEGVEIPESYIAESKGTVESNGTAKADGTSTANGTVTATLPAASPAPLPGLFAPEDMEVLAYNLPAGVSVNGGIATVNFAEAGTTPPLLLPDAGLLFSGTATVRPAADDTVRITLTMHQRMRQVRFTLTITDGDPERITSVKARLEGVAASINLRTGEVTGNAAAVALPFVRTGNKLTTEVWLAGIVAATGQQIVTALTFADHNRSETTANVTDIFENFNADKLTPLHVTGTIYAPVGSEPDGTIIDWKQNNGGDVDANM